MQRHVRPCSLRTVLRMTGVMFLMVSGSALASGQSNVLRVKAESEMPKVSPLLKDLLEQSDRKANFPIEMVVTDTVLFNAWCVYHARSRPPYDEFTENTFILQLELTKNEILNFKQASFVISMEIIRPPKIELKQEGMDYSLNEVTLSRHLFPDLTGSGLTISIKEELFDTVDIDFKNRIIPSEFSPSNITFHATNMASIAAGGGNSDPTAKGAAWDSYITSSDFARLLPDEDIYFLEDQVSVQNHAYGTGIENYYGIEAVAYDAFCQRLPHLLHVFSAGNSGELAPDDGRYKGLTGWSNLTGQFKQSKNTLSIGATDSLLQIMSLSSRGPAFDGRIKPDLVAYGHGGSSGAAALVSGASILLQDAFQNLYPGTLPPSSLIRALLINTALDIGNRGPDFIYGFGSLKLNHAITALINQNYKIGHLKHGDHHGINIQIPAGTKEFKITIAWNDPPGEVLSSKPLINDLDLSVIYEVSSEIFSPWKLNIFPHADSLSQPAGKGIDTINNVEQITIENPAEGNYSIQVSGSNMQTDSQTFAVVWEITLANQFQWIFPTASDFIIPNQHNLLRWNSSMVDQGRVEYRSIHSAEWLSIAENINPSTRAMKWIPSFAGPAQVRWNDGIQLVTSDTFLITTPLMPEVKVVCVDSFQLGWENKEGADSFEVLFLGEQHLEHFAFTRDTVISIQHSGQPITHFAVASIFDQRRGPVSYGLDYRRQGVGCYLNTFYLDHVLDNIATMVALFGSIERLDSVTLEEKQGDEFVSIETVSLVTDSVLSFESPPLKNGINYFRLSIVLNDGSVMVSDTIQVYFTGNSIYIFPNPATPHESIQVLLNGQLDGEIFIFDMAGKKYFSGRPDEIPFTIEVSQFPPGIYIMSFFSDGGTYYSGKFVVMN